MASPRSRATAIPGSTGEPSDGPLALLGRGGVEDGGGGVEEPLVPASGRSGRVPSLLAEPPLRVTPSTPPRSPTAGVARTRRPYSLHMDNGTMGELKTFAASYRDGEFVVHRAAVTLDERQDGEPVTRVALLLDDPAGDTWDVDQVQELRTALGRKATDLGLPPVSVTLVPESEVGLVEAFGG